MRYISIMVIFNLLTTGALCAPTQAINDAGLAIEARKVATEIAPALGARNVEPMQVPQPEGQQICTIGKNGIAGYIPWNDVVAQADFLCQKLGGRYAGKSKQTAAIVCHGVPVSKGLSGKIAVPDRRGGSRETFYMCLAKH